MGLHYTTHYTLRSASLRRVPVSLRCLGVSIRRLPVSLRCLGAPIRRLTVSLRRPSALLRSWQEYRLASGCLR